MKKRIETMADFIPPYKYLADIGCDHGYLIKEAFIRGIEYAQAIDNKKGPLKSATKNLSYFKNKVSFSLSNGLEELNSLIDVVVIAGMGGKLIVRIIEAGQENLDNIKRIIIQANKDNYELRKYMVDIGFKIASEKLIEEEGIYYEIIVFEKGKASYTYDRLFFGPILMIEKSGAFGNKWQQILSNYKNLNKKEVQNKIEYIKETLDM